MLGRGGMIPKSSYYKDGAQYQFDERREVRELQSFGQGSREQQNQHFFADNVRRETYGQGSSMSGYPDINQRNDQYDDSPLLPQLYDEEDERAAGWRPSVEDQMDTLPPLQPQPWQQNNREIEFSNRRPTSIGSDAPNLVVRGNIDKSLRPLPPSQSSFDHDFPNGSLRQQGQMYDNQKQPKNRFLFKRGERNTHQQAEQEVAFGPNSRPKYQSNYDDDSQRQVRDTKSTRFGEGGNRRLRQMKLGGSRGMPPRPPRQPPPRVRPNRGREGLEQQSLGELSDTSPSPPPQPNREPIRGREQQPILSNGFRPPPPQQQQKQRQLPQQFDSTNRSPLEQISYGDNTPRQGKLLKSFQKQQKNQQQSVYRGIQRQEQQQRRTQVPDYSTIQRDQLQQPLEKSMSDITNGVDTFDRGIESVKKLVKRIAYPFASIMGQRKNDNPMSEEERISNALLADAQSYLLADPEIRGLLGDTITVGEASSRSYSSTMVDGMTRSSIQISFSVDSSLDRAQGTLLGNQDGITRLDVDVEGLGFIDVPVGRKSGGRSGFENTFYS